MQRLSNESQHSFKIGFELFVHNSLVSIANCIKSVSYQLMFTQPVRSRQYLHFRYALFARDLFVVPQKQFHIGESIELPQLPSEFANDVGGVPPYLIVNIMLPK